MLGEKHIWPFNANKAGMRMPFPRTTSTGRIKEYTLEVAPATIIIGGRRVATWAYNGGLPGPELRVTVKNRLQKSEGTSIHWHGVPLPTGCATRFAAETVILF